MKKEMTCICCPIGCQMEIELAVSGEILSVGGNTCPRGNVYAREELTHPTRVLTSSVRIHGRRDMLSVKTAAPISKEKLFEAMEKVQNTVAVAPVKIGDVIIKDIADGVDLVATRDVF